MLGDYHSFAMKLQENSIDHSSCDAKSRKEIPFPRSKRYQGLMMGLGVGWLIGCDLYVSVVGVMIKLSCEVLNHSETLQDFIGTTLL